MNPPDQQKVNKQKTAMIDSIMGNPKLSRVIHEAAAAPLGSTKRDKAKATISILKKSDPKQRLAGQGGPGMDGQGGPFDLSTLLSGSSISDFDQSGGNNFGGLTGFSGGNNDNNNNSNFFSPYGGNNWGGSSLFDGGNMFGSTSHTIFPSTPSFKLSNTSLSDIPSLSDNISKYFTGGNGKAPDSSTSSDFLSSFPTLKSKTKLNMSLGGDFGLSAMGGLPGLGSSFDTLPNLSNSGNLLSGVSMNDISPNMIKSGMIGADGKPIMVRAPIKDSPQQTTDTTSGSTDTTGAGLGPVLGPQKQTDGTTGTSQNLDDPNGYSESLLKPTFSGHGIINGYDITSYATDPNHETAVLGIYNQMADFDMTDATSAQDAITQFSPKSPVTGQMVINAANQYGVDPKLVIALMMQDSSLGTKGLGVKTNNPGNVGNDGTKGRTYNTLQGGVNAVAQWLSKHPATQNEPGGDTAGSTTGRTTGGTTQTGQATGEVDYNVAYQALPDAIKSNIGPDLFAKMYGGASYADQLPALMDSLKTQYGLNDYLSRLTDLQKMQPTFKQDMVDYVRSRDTFVGQVDGMINNLDAKRATTDVSGNSALVDNYRNFLLGMKGEQNQVYADYLQKGVDRYNSDLTTVTNQYQNALTAYNSTLSMDEETLKANYEQTQKILSSMYTTAQEAPLKLAQLTKDQLQINKLQLDNADSGNKSWMPQLASYGKDAQIWNVDSTTGAIGTLTSSDVNLPAKTQLLSVDQNYDPAGVFWGYTTAAHNSLKSMVGGKDATGAVKPANPAVLMDTVKYANQLDQALTVLSPTQQTKLAPVVADDKKGLVSDIQRGMENYIEQNYDNVLKASKELSGYKTTRWFSSGVFSDKTNAALPSLANFIKDNKNVDPNVLTAIYNATMLMKNGDPKYQQTPMPTYNIIDGLKSATDPRTTSGAARTDGKFLNDSTLTPQQKLAGYLALQIVGPFQYLVATQQPFVVSPTGQ